MYVGAQKLYGVLVQEAVDVLWVGYVGVYRCIEKQGESMWMKKNERFGKVGTGSAIERC